MTETPDPEDAPDAGREVYVPMRLYKTVTVFSTLIAVVAVIGGFVLLDTATQRATADLSEVDPLLALAGLACIAAGGAVYAFATRFQAETRNGNDEEGQTTDNE